MPSASSITLSLPLCNFWSRTILHHQYTATRPYHGGCREVDNTHNHAILLDSITKLSIQWLVLRQFELLCQLLQNKTAYTMLVTMDAYTEVHAHTPACSPSPLLQGSQENSPGKGNSIKILISPVQGKTHQTKSNKTPLRQWYFLNRAEHTKPNQTTRLH